MSEGTSELTAPATESAPPPVADSTPSAPAAPQSTHDIAAQAIAAAESGPPEDSAEPPVETPPREPEPEPELSPAAKFLAEHGHVAKNKRGGETWLPLKVVESMLAKYHGHHEKTWNGERETLSTEAKTAKAHLEALRASFTNAENTDAFIKEVAAIDPRYARYLQQQQAAPPAPVPEAFPQPDVPLSDGSATYSMRGLQEQVFPWMLQKAREAAKAEAAEQLKPVQQREQQWQEAAQHAQRQERVRSLMTDAQTWPGFGSLATDGSLTDFQTKVLTRLKGDKSMSLRQAYLEERADYLAADDTEKRKRFQEELKNAPASTSVTRPGPESTQKPGKRSTADITRATLARLEAGS